MLRIIYYLLAIILGILLTLLVVGSSTRTEGYLDGELIENQLSDSDFLMKNLQDIKTKTMVDYDGLLSQLIARKTNIFPTIIIDGDLETPNRVDLFLIFFHTLIVLLVFWLLRVAFLRLRSNK